MPLYLRFLIFSVVFLSSCSYTQKIKTGDVAYERKQYSNAVNFYKGDFERAKVRSEKGKIAYLVAESYKKMNQIESATDWYLKAWDNGFGPESLEAYAYGLKSLEKYDEALHYFKEAGIEFGNPQEYRKEITACKLAKDWKKNIAKTGFVIKNLDWNSSVSDYAPFLFQNNIYFTSDKKNGSDLNYTWFGKPYHNAYKLDLDSEEINPLFFNKPLSNQGRPTFDKSGKKMVFSDCSQAVDDKNYCSLYISEKPGEVWTDPVKIDFEIEANFKDPFLSDDGNTLYYASDDAEGWGGYDIYYSKFDGNTWSSPKLMSRSINSSGNEVFPFFHADTLYFSSDYHTGMGGLDIFRTYKYNNGEWSPIQNLKAPINSGADDFGVFIQNNTGDIIQSGYFCSNRFSGKGGDDIYGFDRVFVETAVKPKVENKAKEGKEVEYAIELEISVLEYVFEDVDNPNSGIKGKTMLEGAMVFNNNDNKNIQPNLDSRYIIQLEKGKDYTFNIHKKGYLNKGAHFSTMSITEDPLNPIQKFELEVILDKIYENKEIVMSDIYYDFDEFTIRKDAEPALTNLYFVLKENPNISIQLSSHTDCQGKESYNLNLSQKRAQAAVDFLIKLGIKPSRLFAKGYGESQPAALCRCVDCNEDEHQQNRRTTFKILGD